MAMIIIPSTRRRSTTRRWWRLRGAATSVRPRQCRKPHVETLESRELLAADLAITEFMASNGSTLTDGDGHTPDWIEIHNGSDRAVELKGWKLTDRANDLDKWAFPFVSLDAGAYLIVFASGDDRAEDSDELHTNFKLSAKGETIGLVSPEGAVVSQFGIDGEDYPPQVSDVSYGITDPGPRYFAVPTPGAANTAGQVGLVGATQVSVDRGFFDAPFQVELMSETPGATIRYTTDGSEPTEIEGTVATGPITVGGTTVLRAAAFKPDYVPGALTTRTYLFLQDVLTQSPDGAVPAGFPEGPVSGNTLNYGMDPDIVNDPVWGPQLIEALTSIPTMSIVTDAGNLFDPVTGIYVNPAGRGKAWERPISVELLNPDGSLGFQVDAGLRIRGGFSRSTGNPKHALRLFFRREYGAAELNFPLFGDEGVDRFQSVDLRTAQNYSWSFGGDVRNTFLRDVFSRDTQGALGQPYTRSRFYHLYINGQYWGMYQTQERAEADYAASYFGGDKEDYDVVKPAGRTKFIEVTDGNLAAYDRLYEATVQGFADDADYFRIQGMNPDGTRNPDFERLLDADNLIDYMLITYYTGDKDGPGSRFTSGRPNNFFAILNREAPDGFKWFEHDSEHSLDTGAVNMVTPLVTERGGFNEAVRQQFNPHWLHEKLMENTEYRLRFADRVQRHFFGNGELTRNRARARNGERAETIETAIVAESARWGDTKKSPPFTKEDWDTAVARINTWFDGRVETVLDQFRTVGWLPEVEPPGFVPQPGGEGTTSSVSLTAPDGVVYFTTDGSDPRRPGGGLNPTAAAFNPSEIYLDGDTPARILAPAGADLGPQWQEVDFDDGTWQSGPAAIGFDTHVEDGTLQVPDGFTVREVHSTGNVSSLAAADALLAGTDVASDTMDTDVSTINYAFDTGGGHFDADQDYPGGAGNNFAIWATAEIVVTVAGTYTFGLNNDDGARLRVDGQTIISDDKIHRERDAFATISLAAGVHTIDFVQFNLSASAAAELFYARGEFSQFNDAFRLLGIEDDRPLDDLIRSDVISAMSGVGGSAYVRTPFEAANTGEIDRLVLRMRYDDGFVAYLNGTEIARRNAPDQIEFDSTATAVRADEDARVSEMIDVTRLAGLLRDGQNVLAIQGLNAAADNPDFLLVPKLEAFFVGDPLPITRSTEIRARTLLEGQWSALSIGPGQVQFILAGDTNQDGRIDRDDVASFALALIDPVAYEAAFGLPAAAAGDLDGDGNLDYDDIAGLVGRTQEQPSTGQAARAVDVVISDLDGGV